MGRLEPDILEFRGKYAFLSNFWEAEVAYEGIIYPSVEHAYQAAKTLDDKGRRGIAGLSTPAEAKQAGKLLRLRTDWDQVRVGIMEELVRQKFERHEHLRAGLLATGTRYLAEGNTWGDRFWGVVSGRGENRLGKLLMRVRQEFSAQPEG